MSELQKMKKFYKDSQSKPRKSRKVVGTPTRPTVSKKTSLSIIQRGQSCLGASAWCQNQNNPFWYDTWYVTGW